MRNKSKADTISLVIGIGLLAGCAALTEPRYTALNHPANPAAPESPAFAPSGALQSYKTPEAFRTDAAAPPSHPPPGGQHHGDH